MIGGDDTLCMHFACFWGEGDRGSRLIETCFLKKAIKRWGLELSIKGQTS